MRLIIFLYFLLELQKLSCRQQYYSISGVLINNNSMHNSRTITINQTYEPNLPQTHNRPASIFPDLPSKQPITTANSLKSLAIVLGQALSTKDQQTIYQLLITATDEVISNTVNELAVGRLAALLEAIEIILLEEKSSMANVNTVSKWLAALLKKNIGHIINSQQLQSISSRISRIIKKRISMLPKLQATHARIPQHATLSTNTIKYTPKFHYIEQEHEINHKQGHEDHNTQKQSDISDIGPEDLGNLDHMLMDDDMDLEI